MKGLILKDLLCLRKVFVSTLLVLGVYTLLAFTGVWELGFIAGFLTVLLAMLPVSCASYDHAAKWDLYARTLPESPAAVVGARYLTALLFMGLALLTSAAVGGIGTALGRMDGQDWPAYALTAVVCLMMGTLFNAIMLPLLYKFGAERARIIFYCVLSAVAAATVLLFLLLRPLLPELDLPRLPAHLLAAELLAAALLDGALLFCSFLLSVHFFQNREL